MNIEFDTPTEDELKLILDSWTSSYRNSKYAGTVPNNLWQEVQRSTIIQLMTRPACRTTVALVPLQPIEEWANVAIANPIFSDKPGTPIRGRVMGYSVAEPGILHWIYTKKDYRRLGVASALLGREINDWTDGQKTHPRFTHMTDSSYRILPKWWKWDPIPARVK